MKISGYILKETEVSNAVILCYKDYKKAKNVYDELEKERYKQNMHTRTYLTFMWNPEDQYPCKVVVQFINRNKDVYVNPPKFPIKGVDLDEFQERTFLSCANLEDCHIIYSGDVPKIK
jgi:hypothetical protein